MMISKDYALAGLYCLEGYVQRTETSMKAHLYIMINTLNTMYAIEINKRLNFFWKIRQIAFYKRGSGG